MLFDPVEFPNLNADNHHDLDPNPYDATYNCIAWSLGIDDDVLSTYDGHTWPGNAPRNDELITSVSIMFQSRGFSFCKDGSVEEGFDKIVLYNTGITFTHVARQLDSGRWTSKMGFGECIEHEAPENLANGFYGTIWKYMKRRRGQPEDLRFVYLFPLSRRAYRSP